MSKTILILAVVVLAGVGGYFLLKGGYQTPTQAPTPAPEEASSQVEEKTVLPEEAPIEEEIAPAPEVKEISVSGKEFSFSPSTITVNSGQSVKVTFQNAGSIAHNFNIEELRTGTRTISPGQTDVLEFTAPAPGTYTVFCSISGHREAGMVGSLIVE